MRYGPISLMIIGTFGCQNTVTELQLTKVCGNGILDEAEACDDGNQNSDAGGDGCAADCKSVEVGWACPTPGEPCMKTRTYRLASSGVQIIPGGSLLFQITNSNLVEDPDVVAIHEEYYGIPWDEFQSGTAPPAEWIAQMNRLAAIGPEAGKDVLLSLLIGREYLTDKTKIVAGQIQRESNWSARCYNFDTAVDGTDKKKAYARYVDWMVRKFQPRWVNVAVEVNNFQLKCPDAWAGMVAAESAAYDAAKAAKPDVIAFPSIQIDSLMGYSECPESRTQAQCFDENYLGINGLKRDRFAISTYPHIVESINRVSKIPSDYFTRAGDRGGERTLIVEAGWNTEPIVASLASTCTTATTSSENEALDYLNLLVSTAESHGIELVTWWSNRDLMIAQAMVDCPCDFDASWCEIAAAFRQAGGSDPTIQFFSELAFKIWGTMGIRRWDGTPKPLLMQRWNELRAVPLAL
jgi:cysteine-rich repeat protein